LSTLAGVYYETKDYAKAVVLYERVLAIREKALGPEHEDVVDILLHLAYAYRATRNYTKVVSLYQRVLAIQEKSLGPDHPKVGWTLYLLAGVYSDLAIYTKSISLYERALAIQEKALGPEHPDVADTLSVMVGQYYLTDDDAKAAALNERILTIKEKTLNMEDPDVVINLAGLASKHQRIGNYAKAESLLQRAMAIEEKTPSPRSGSLVLVLDGLARLYHRMGDPVKAESLWQQALAIREKALGPEHEDVVNTLVSMARRYYYSPKMIDYTKAESLLQRALAIQEKKTARADYNYIGNDVPNILTQLAKVSQAKGDYGQAESLLQRALGIREQVYGADSFGVLDVHINLGLNDVAQQRYRPAVMSLRKGLAIEDKEFHGVFAFTTEEQKLEFVQSRVRNYHIVLSLIYQHLKDDRESVREGLELVLSRKGIVFDAQSRTREGLRNRLSEQARLEWDLLSSRRSELARLLLNKPQTMSSEQYRERLAALQQQIEQSEQRLAGESAFVAKELEQRKITVETVARALPKNAALVEFVKIRNFFAKDTSWRYLAFVLSASGDMSLHDLGDATQLEGQVQRALRDIKVSMEARGLQILKKSDAAMPSRPSVQALKTLHSQVWAPVQKVLGSADKIVVSPDGLLTLVPFAALMDGEGHALVERYQLAYVTGGRELVATEGAALKPESDLLLVANPAFDGTVQVTDTAETSLLSRDFRGVFRPLPGTAREAKEIPPLVAGQERQKRVLEGINATERAVKGTRSPRILHLATHGFFLQDEEFDLCAVTRGLTIVKKVEPELTDQCEKVRGVTVVRQEKPVPPKQYENPLIRSGLAFAGANKASQIMEGDDGILTALEITGMDLYGTELVVLSACDTGVGEVKTGEGVFGLRRAFALAGAKNLLMSLWPVNDEITANQMNAFYRNLQALPPAEALRQAQLESIRDLKAFGIYGETVPPGLWAPFILQGGQALGR
ncbi:MAG: CHAT domain-containing protein, partial [Nitrospirae bacterium]